MKLLLLCLITFYCSASIAVPNKFLKFDKNYTEIINAQGEALEESTNLANVGGFKFSHFSTSFSVTRSGILGLSGVSGQRSVELFWKRKTATSENFDKSITINIGSQKGLDNFNIRDFIGIVQGALTVLDVYTLQDGIRVYLTEIKQLFRSIGSQQRHNWRFDGLRSDVYIAADGTFSTVAQVGGAVRVRLEWKVPAAFERKEKKNRMSRLVSKLLADIDYSLKYKKNQAKSFGHLEIKKAYVGVGKHLTTNLFGLASTSSKFQAFARFVRISENDISDKEDLKNTNDSYSIQNEVEKDEALHSVKGLGLRRVKRIFKFKRSKMRSGLIRALGMSRFFTSKAETSFPNWEVFKVITKFQVSKRGFLGLSSSRRLSLIELEFDRPDSNNPSKHKDKSWALDLFRIKIAAYAGIKVPFLASVKVSPEVELFWLK